MGDNESPALPKSPKVTLVGGISGAAAHPSAGPPVSVSATLRGLSGTALPMPSIDLDGTIGVPELYAAVEMGRNDATAAGASSVPGMSTWGRTTVLPRRKDEAHNAPHSAGQRARFDRIRVLGQGAMGEVELARDNDIRRTVAVKRVLEKDMSNAALLRFADEVRVVGQLEHPGIVPIYDVGRDDDGRVYLVMKHLHGETMEDILQHLRDGDKAYLARFTIDYRIHLFLSVLDAVSYAHARGILHRDLKPANIQIGPYGEVTVMDWGIAKPFRRSEKQIDVKPLDNTVIESHDQRLVQTHFGLLAGTPLYMSPEQAAGRNEELDDRSDVFALCVMFYEWLVLDHPMREKSSVVEVLAATVSRDYEILELARPARAQRVPIEYVHVLFKGLARDRKKRIQSVAELERAISRVRGGWIPIECQVTFGKYIVHALARWIDCNTRIYLTLLYTFAAAVLIGVAFGLWRVLHAFL